MLLLLITFFGDATFRFFGIETPKMVKSLTENKLQAFLLLWLFGNMVIGALTNTGAFEIYYDNQTIWSSLDHQGALPKLQDILYGARKVGLKLMTSINDP